ncbi:hypothetical protein FHX49_002410 [Microbacterium endophyticum]|uniref:Lipoprotein n=1 Tax=Microbacterium endophyticum TaxID=1526412 RepID=A0A7W4YNR1_9MICO|nr:hypothetical protein [Microbacterium endophyticum]MBB2976824.1 hypothetical protein [Microbacterium endophyticum]NIK36539.1 hypothetical protein [Microbacterium endophyticum]
MNSRTVLPLLLATVVVVVGVSGCAATPEPAEETTAEWTEAEAFAAAEETYRSYVDALNQVDLSDPDTFEAVYAWTTGDANTGERESLSKMHAEGWTVSGESKVLSFDPASFSSSDMEVSGVVCLDISSIEVVNSSGEDQVDEDRLDVYPLNVKFSVERSTDTGMQISKSERVESASCG